MPLPAWALAAIPAVGSAVGGYLGRPETPKGPDPIRGQLREGRTSTEGFLGDLPPELEGADIDQLLQQIGLSRDLAGELMNMPDELRYDALSQDVLGGEGGPIGGLVLA